MENHWNCIDLLHVNGFRCIFRNVTVVCEVEVIIGQNCDKVVKCVENLPKVMKSGQRVNKSCEN